MLQSLTHPSSRENAVSELECFSRRRPGMKLNDESAQVNKHLHARQTRVILTVRNTDADGTATKID